MHDGYKPECAHCLHFVLAFHTALPPADWGYCLVDGGQPPAKEELDRIKEEANRGNMDRLLAGEQGLFQLLGQVCERFEYPFPI